SSASHLWVAVKKERTLRKFTLNGETLTEVQAGQVFPAEGCAVELTGLSVTDADYWSVALEAYGDPSRVEESLLKAAATVLSDPPPSVMAQRTFSAAFSCSYPEWLEGRATRS